MHQIWTLAVSGLVLGAGVLLVAGWLGECGLPGVPRPRVAEAPKLEVGLREAAAVFGVAFAFRVAVFLAAELAVCLIVEPGTGGAEGLNIWRRWDAWHYVNLVELGYSGYVENGQHLFVVFFPLYVWLVRLIRLLTGNTMAAGLLVSFACFAGGCVYLYRLAAWEYGRAAARRALVFLSVFPFAFFFGGVMTESLFLLTTAAALWHIRRHQWLAAGLWGALAALTRMHGLLLIGAAGAELFSYGRPLALPGRERKRTLLARLKTLPVIFLPVVGTLIYLGLNHAVTGSPFGFVSMQEHWSQGFCWISDTLWYVLHNAMSYQDEATRLLLWVPELVLFPLFFALLLWAARRQESTFTLYAFVTLVLDYSLSWLLSAGRYLSCAVPFFLFMAVLTGRRPRLAVGLAGVMAGLFAVFLLAYLSGAQVM